MNGVMQRMWETSHLSGGSAAYVEELYEVYLRDPNAVSGQWQAFFAKLSQSGQGVGGDVSHAAVREQFVRLGKGGTIPPQTSAGSSQHRQMMVLQLINAYRHRGHQQADIDPLGLLRRHHVADLSLEHHGLAATDLDTCFQTGLPMFEQDAVPLKEIVARLNDTYCSTIGAEFMHIVDSEQRHWLQQRLETQAGKNIFDAEAKKSLLEQLAAAEGLEKYLGAKYPGTKRFGLEGGEALIPLIHELIERVCHQGTIREIVIGMAHRGRLNVLVNIFGKKPAELFDEFEGKQRSCSGEGSGDVKYHQGFSSNIMTPHGEVHLALAFNPSHLEIVSPVVQGSVRARQDRRQDHSDDQVVPIALHGDAAFAGQGVVMETFQLSQTRAYGTGGTIHVVVNNQIGFTTSRAEDARSTEYCTDVAKMVDAPILHVNGDDPEAVVFVSRLAADYRQRFKRDIVIDLVCYRRRGHNEADEPSGTQPLMYSQIKNQKTTHDKYAEALVAAGIVTEEYIGERVAAYRKALDNGEHVARNLVTAPNTRLYVDWTPYLNHKWTARHDTRVKLADIQQLGHAICDLPPGFAAQRQVGKILDDRRKMAAGALPINWGMAEMLAYATLLTEGHPVRLTGQDVGRGTFSHRHAILHNQKDNSLWVSLAHLADDQPQLQIYDSVLSEEAVLAFEYGYATTTPEALVVWEAQFGDFANGAQVVIDQFITSGETKWGRLCGLVMLLPHGYEGQGPEHSSARLERFLQLSAEHNIQVCIPTTPAQVFHMLRRQVIRPLRKPLIVFSPKSLLRHKLAVSTLEELSDGVFHTVLNDKEVADPKQVSRIVICSGKVYYDLLERCRAEELDHVALIRIEQLYPFPEDDLFEALGCYPHIDSIIWCQEEPMNQGAWYASQHHLRRLIERLDGRKIAFHYAGRDASAAPACGSMSMHAEQQERFVADALGLK